MKKIQIKAWHIKSSSVRWTQVIGHVNPYLDFFLWLKEFKINLKVYIFPYLLIISVIFLNAWFYLSLCGDIFRKWYEPCGVKGASIIKEWTYKYIDSVSSCILCFFFFSLKKFFQLQTTLLFQTPIRLLTGSQFPKSVPGNCVISEALVCHSLSIIFICMCQLFSPKLSNDM